MSLLRINQNISSLNAQRNLTNGANRIALSIERLSSGLRINRASDDPSGLVLSEHLRWQVSGLAVAEQNALEGVNLVKTAEGGLIEIQALLRQIRDLAVDAASDSNNNDQSRAALQEQVSSALRAIDQIATTTKYANRGLLDGSAGVSATVLDTTNISQASLTSTAGAGYADIQVTTAAEKAHMDTSTQYAGGVGSTVANAGTITINNHQITVKAGDTVQDVINAINAISSQTGVTASWDNATKTVDLDQVSYGSDKGIIYVESAEILNGGNTGVEWGVDAVATVTWGDSTTSTMNQGTGLVLKDSAGNTITLTTAGNQVTTHQDAIYVTQGSVSFQIGVNVGETASISISACGTAQLGVTGTLASIDISTVAGANSALTIIDEAIEQVGELRGKLGAFQANELEPQIRNIAVARENLAASESAIRDTDFGREMAEFTTAQILVQSATAFLAQANMLPQAVLQLIR
jgi:flagellin